MNAEAKVTPAQIAYRTVLLAAGLLLFGLVFRQLVTLLLAILMTVIVAIPLAAAAERLQRRGIPRPVGALEGEVDAQQLPSRAPKDPGPGVPADVLDPLEPGPPRGQRAGIGHHTPDGVRLGGHRARPLYPRH